MVILKRCGVVSEKLQNYDQWRICSNHLLLLTSGFPVEEVCQICHTTTGQMQPISPFQQDLLLAYVPGMILGQKICLSCLKKVQNVAGKKFSASQGDFLWALLQNELISEESYKEQNSRQGSEIANSERLERWVHLSHHDPFAQATSSVPPLR